MATMICSKCRVEDPLLLDNAVHTTHQVGDTVFRGWFHPTFSQSSPEKVYCGPIVPVDYTAFAS